MTGEELVGRAVLLERARRQLEAGGSLLLYGPTGIGKSAVGRSLSAARAVAGHRVLSAAPSRSEAGLPYVTLLDLLGDQLEAALPALPNHLRQPLEVALLKTSAPDSMRDELAVRLAVLQVLRRLVGSGPVLIWLDDLQWVDQSSLEVLTFCARRLTDGVQMVATEQLLDGDLPSRAAACPEPAMQLEVPALSEAEVIALLRARLPEPLPVRTARRIFAASAGNPFMSLELGRAVLRHPDELSPEDPLPVPNRLRTLLGDRLADLGTSTREVLLVAASSPRPTASQLAVAVGHPVDAELAEAERLALVDVQSGRLRFSHPLLREFVYAEASPAARRSAHARLAAVVDEPVETARHRALATQESDAELAAALDRAASVAGRRGAPGAAATLWRLAADRTPPQDRAGRCCRLIHAARKALAGGHVEEAAAVARLAIEVAPDRAGRVTARLALVDAVWPNRDQRSELLAAAFADAVGDVALEARVRIQRSHSAYYDRRLDDARHEARTAEALARKHGDTEALIEALQAAGNVEMSVAGAGADALLEEAGRLAEGLELTESTLPARQMGAMRELFRGRAEVAWNSISTLVCEVRDRGAMRWLASVLVSATAIADRSGRPAEALAAGHECRQLLQDIGDEPEVGLVVAAGAECVGGSVAEAQRLAENAVQACRAAGNDEWLGPALAVLGRIRLLAGDPQHAVEAFGAVEGVGAAAMPYDPAIIPWQADYAEALVASGRLAEAEQLIGDVRARAAALGRAVTAVGLGRAEALLMAKRGEPAASLELLERTERTAGGEVYPLDLARCELTRGRIARQARRRSTARAAFLAAIEQFERLGATPWRKAAEAEMARLDLPGRAREPLELTGNELQIVGMVREGSTNREIAAALYLSVKAVESQLTRLYRRFGVANRTQLLRTVDRAVDQPTAAGQTGEPGEAADPGGGATRLDPLRRGDRGLGP